jgi:hypothetical protein
MATARGVTQRSTTSIQSLPDRGQAFLWTVATTEEGSCRALMSRNFRLSRFTFAALREFFSSPFSMARPTSFYFFLDNMKLHVKLHATSFYPI